MSYQPTVERDFYLVRDVCAVTGLGKASVQEGIKRGELPGYKVGGRYVIPGEAFRALYNGTWVPQPRGAEPSDATAAPDALEDPRERDPKQFLRHFEDYGHAV